MGAAVETDGEMAAGGSDAESRRDTSEAVATRVAPVANAPSFLEAEELLVKDWEAGGGVPWPPPQTSRLMRRDRPRQSSSRE